MAAFNGEQYIAQSINSVLSQTVTDLELIIVDDGSSDRTPNIVRDLQAGDDRIKYFRQANAGQAAARNKAMAMSSGELIAFIDQDDLWLDHKLEAQVKALKESNADIVFSNGYIFGPEVADLNMYFPIVHGKFSGAEMFRLLFNENQIPMPSAVVRTEALQSIAVLEEHLRYQNADDYDLWLRLAAAGRTFVGMPDKLIRYRIHSSQASTDAVKMLKAELAVLRQHESNPLLTKEGKVLRFRVAYEKLVRALVEQGKYTEARKYLKEILGQARYPPTLLAQSVLLGLMPGHFTGILDLAHRARESVSYRITQPLQRAVRLIIN
jgi:glycosyltransferase involved in cell wall biosynthesis